MMPVKRLSLTDMTCKIPRAAREKTLKKALEADGVMAKWAASAWAKKLKVKEAKKGMTDFDRFKLYQAKKKRSKIVKAALKKKLKVKEAKKGMTDFDRFKL